MLDQPSTLQLQSLEEAWRQAEAIKSSWRAGTLPNAAQALRDHPTLQTYKSIVVDLAYEEFVLQELKGERLSPEDFVARMPAFQASIAKVLKAHRLLLEHPEIIPIPRSAISWPESGRRWQGLDLLTVIGQGGFSRVYLAYDPDTDRHCVLKLTPGPTSEGQMLGRLKHPHISDIYWAKSFENWMAVCVPFVGVTTLEDLRARLFPTDHPPTRSDDILDAIDPLLLPSRSDRLGTFAIPCGFSVSVGITLIVAKIADALAYAHQCGIVHGDLKPSNVIVGAGGHPYLIDFNLSATQREWNDRPRGTFPYMAPELLESVQKSQVIPLELGRSADIYAFGVLLHELLTGKLPFPVDQANSDLIESQLTAIRAGEVCSPLPLEIPQKLRKLATACLAYRVEDRPRNASDLALQLAEITDEILGNRKQQIGRRKRILLLAGIGVAIGLGWSISLIRSDRPGTDLGELSSAEAYFDRGLSHLENEKFKYAIMDFDRADQYMLDPNIQGFNAYAHARAGHLRDSSIIAFRAIEKGNTSVEVLNNFGHVLVQLGEPDRAIDYLDRALSQSPKAIAPRFNRATAYSRVDADGTGFLTRRRAADDLTELLKNDPPPSAQLYHFAGLVYARTTRLDPAIRDVAILYLTKAAEYGKDPASFPANLTIQSALGNDPKYRVLCQSRPGTARATEADWRALYLMLPKRK